MPASSNVTMAKGKNAATAVVKKRFVKLVQDDTDSVEQCDTGGEDAYGVAIYSVSTLEIAKGKLVSVQTDGRAIVEAASAVGAGEYVTTDGDGKGVVATSGDVVLGMCDEPGGGTAGDEISVDLSKRAGIA